MGSRNYLINVADLSVTDRGKYKLSALAAGLERCAIKGIGDVNSDIPGLQAIPDVQKADRVTLITNYLAQGKWPKSITQRELTPALNGDLVAVTALDSWLTAAFAAVGTFYSCFQAIASPQLAQDKLMVLYGISSESVGVPNPPSRLVIRRGGATGNIIAQYDMEQQAVRQEWDAFFSEPQVIDPQQAFAIQARAKNATGVAEIIHLHNFLFEASGLIVT
jgi:hypothetical protein